MNTTDSKQPEPSNEAEREAVLAAPHGSAAEVESEVCPECDGQGWWGCHNQISQHIQIQCETCYGTGRVEKAKPQPNE